MSAHRDEQLEAEVTRLVELGLSEEEARQVATEKQFDWPVELGGRAAKLGPPERP